jgi:hypothetical protein
LPGRWVRKRNFLHFGFASETHGHLRDSAECGWAGAKRQ